MLAAIAAVLGTGVAAAADDDAPSAEATEVAAAVKLEAVSAYGEGCPHGSYGAVLAPDGQTVTVTFSKFAPIITPAHPLVADDCRLAIVFRAPVRASYRVERFVVRGYAYLEPGVDAVLSTSHYFQLDQSRSEQGRSALKGPNDGAYVIEAPTVESDLWSPCGLTAYQTLNVQLHVQLRNPAEGRPPADGTLEVHDGLAIKLNWRQC